MKKPRSLKIKMLATGSRGDVQPYVALGYALQQRGHQVSIASNAHFESWVRGYDLDFRSIDWDAQASLQSEHGQGMIAGRLLDTIRYVTQETPRIFAQVQRSSWDACQGAENLLYSVLSPWGYDIAQALGIPGIPGALHPMFPTRAFPTQMFPIDLPPPLNLVTHYLAEWLLWQVMRAPLKKFRQGVLGLKPLKFPQTLFSVLREQKSPIFFALSPTVIHRPADWPEYVHMNGYWFLDASPGWEPAPQLVEFIQAGPQPVYIGFGSMANQEPKLVTRLVIEALQRCGQRGLLASGWGGLQSGELPESVFTIDQAPHAWLFPQMAAVVHHGGAGTTAAGLRAGVPSIVIPHMQDQPYWGRRVHDLGVGPTPIPRRKLTAENLANAITQVVRDQGIRKRAKQVGEKIRVEDGLGETVKSIEAYLSQEPGR